MAASICGVTSLRIEAEENEILAFASEELQKYTARMLGDGRKTGQTCTVYMGYTEEFFRAHGLNMQPLCYDGYQITPVADGWAFCSRTPRGVLFAVYDFLRSNGCRFIRAAGMREKIPQRSALSFHERLENPDLETRGLTVGVSEVNADWEKQTIEIVDWAAKNRLNMIFLHESIDQPFGGTNAAVAEEIARRGLLLEYGGHGIQNYIDRGMYETHPEYFIEKEGKRVSSGNFCVSSREALAIAGERLLRFLRESNKIDVLHVWFEDTIGGSWCECEKCRGKLPVQQMKEAVAYFAELVKEEFPDLRLDLLLYHDTLDSVDKIGSLPENMILEFAARERCYAHPIDAENCALNRKYLQKLDDCVKAFGGERIEIFEYYMDFILFSKVKTVLAHTIAADLRCFASRGIRRIAPLSFGLYSFWAYDVNLYVYAEHAFHTGLDADKTIAAFIADFGLPEGYGEYLRLMENFTSLYFAFCGYEHCYDDIRGLPLCSYFGEHLKYIAQGIEVLGEASALLGQMQAAARGDAAEYLQWETKIADISLSECKGLCLRMQARLENQRTGGKERAKLLHELETVKTNLYGILSKIRKIPPAIKGVQGGTLFEEHLCKDQIWTVNELLSKEFDMDVDLDRSII